jgi:hypothetical protein
MAETMTVFQVGSEGKRMGRPLMPKYTAAACIAALTLRLILYELGRLIGL